MMEKLEVREKVARYLKKFQMESQKLQQQMSDIGPESEKSYVSLTKPTSLAINLLELQNLECHTDVCINCMDGSFFVHSGILMSASPIIMNYFVKTNQPENFDPQGRRHLDMKSFPISETASILFLFYTGSSMYHDLEETPTSSAKKVSEAKQKLLMKILARFGTESVNLVMSIPIAGSASSQSSNPLFLRFSRKHPVNDSREDFFISLTGQITPAPAILPLVIPNELITAPEAAEDCDFCPIVCTPTSSRKVHLENCKYATASRKSEEEPAAFKMNDNSILFSKPHHQNPVSTPSTISTPISIPVPTALVLANRHSRSPQVREEPPEQKKKHHVSRKEEHYTDIRRTFQDCKEKSMKRNRVSLRTEVEQVPQDKPSKPNKENYRPCKETSSDSEYEEPELRRHKKKKKRVSQWINKSIDSRPTPGRGEKQSECKQKVVSQLPQTVVKSLNHPSQTPLTKEPPIIIKEEIPSWTTTKPSRSAHKSTG